MTRRMRTMLVGAGVVLLGGCSLGTDTDSFAPFVEITSPLTQVVRGRVDFSATVVDDSGIAQVRFLVDGVLLARDTTGPFVTDWVTTTYADGAHTLLVEATDLQGNRNSASRGVTVNNATPN